MEGRLWGREKLNQLLIVPDIADIEKVMAEGGVDKQREYGLKSAFAAVAESLPDRSLLHFLQYPYDCHNLKTLEKCRLKGVDSAELLIDLGSVSAKTLLTVSQKELLTLLPAHLAQAVIEAGESYARTRDPREIDFIFDRALYADMQAAAAPYPFAAEFVKMKADLVNLMICLRLLRMQGGELGRATLLRAAIPVGSFDEGFLLACYEGGEEVFCKQTSKTPYAAIFERGQTLADTERKADDCLMAWVRRARQVTFGAEVPIAYIFAVQQQSLNLRILLAGREAGLDAETIRARMRESYV